MYYIQLKSLGFMNNKEVLKFSFLFEKMIDIIRTDCQGAPGWFSHWGICL